MLGAESNKKRNANHPARYRFGGLVLDTGRRRLTDAGRSIPLGRLTFDLLRALVEAAPNAVSHDRLAQEVWGSRPVSPETLSQRVKLLRDALSDDAENPRYIEVIRGHGLRLITPVRPLRQRVWLDLWRRPIPVAAVALAGLALLASIMVWHAANAPASIAVVPFTPVSDVRAEDSRLGEDLAQEVIDRLSQLSTLRVFPSSATFAFRNNIDGLHEPDSGPGATHVLKGTVQRTEDTVRVTAQLIECATGYQVWSGAREFEDADPGAAEQLADYVARELEIALSSETVLADGGEGPLAMVLDPD